MEELVDVLYQCTECKTVVWVEQVYGDTVECFCQDEHCGSIKMEKVGRRGDD